jgi:hypothetical protein
LRAVAFRAGDFFAAVLRAVVLRAVVRFAGDFLAALRAAVFLGAVIALPPWRLSTNHHSLQQVDDACRAASTRHAVTRKLRSSRTTCDLSLHRVSVPLGILDHTKRFSTLSGFACVRRQRTSS